MRGCVGPADLILVVVAVVVVDDDDVMVVIYIVVVAVAGQSSLFCLLLFVNVSCVAQLQIGNPINQKPESNGKLLTLSSQNTKAKLTVCHLR